MTLETQFKINKRHNIIPFPSIDHLLVCVFVRLQNPVNFFDLQVLNLQLHANSNRYTGLGAKSQNLSSVAPPRKKKLVTIFSQGHVLGP